MTRHRARVLVVGIGGLGCPAALARAPAGVGTLGLCDDDPVEPTNLHRQILFEEGDVGAPQVDAAARALMRRGMVRDALVIHPTRLLPDNAVSIVSEYDVVVEGSDNFATKFLTADACALARVPVLHASAVRWIGTVLAAAAHGGPCYRCLFEDLPHEDVPNCAEAGVLGPVVGVVAAAQVDLALAVIDGLAVSGQLVTFDGRTDVFRRTTIRRRGDCPLCGSAPRIRGIEWSTYVSPACAG